MRCTCRTSSLRIFVSSLTGLQVSHRSAVVPRSIVHGTTVTASSQVRQHRYLARSFSAATLPLRSSQEAWKSSDSPTAAAAEESTGETLSGDDQLKPDDGAAARRESANNNPTTINTSADDLDRAKSEGVILDFSPEALDSIMASYKPQQRNASRGSPPTERGTAPTPRSRSEKSFSSNHSDYKSSSSSSNKPKRQKSIQQSGKRRRWEEEQDEEYDEYDEHDEHEDAKTKKKGTTTTTTTWRPPKQEHWQIQKAALREKFPEGWAPRKRLSPDALDGIRALHAQFPAQYPTEVLARRFEVSAEAIRRILRGKWAPGTAEGESRRQERWFNRGKRVWEQMAALGKKPPRRWREEGIVRDPSWHQGRRRGPRTEWPYMPRKRFVEEEDEGQGGNEGVGEQGERGDELERESPHRKLSGNLF